MTLPRYATLESVWPIESPSMGRVECVSFGMWRSPSGRASWRMPDTYHTAGIRRGPPPQLLRRPGQPRPRSQAAGSYRTTSSCPRRNTAGLHFDWQAAGVSMLSDEPTG